NRASPLPLSLAFSSLVLAPLWSPLVTDDRCTPLSPPPCPASTPLPHPPPLPPPRHPPASSLRSRRAAYRSAPGWRANARFPLAAWRSPAPSASTPADSLPPS